MSSGGAGFKIGDRVAAEELGHLDDPASVGLVQFQDSIGRDEGLDVGDGAADVARPSVSGVPWSEPTASSTRLISSRRPAGSSSGIGLPGKSRTPVLPSDHCHLGFDARCLALGFRQDLCRGKPRIQLELELACEQVRADPPVVAGAGQHLVLEEREMLSQGRGDRLRLVAQARPGRARCSTSLKRSA